MELHQVSHRQIGQTLIGNVGRKEKYYQIWLHMRYLMKVIFGQDIIFVFQNGSK